ncbi:6038_t:CDS:1 [Diversispora eburnea]|uniref:6038_t:CDS:1 n=1 Tax=Diversispora eburnea TaxID=1213867 RepID=A0A9N9B8W9_9GLOM|nr:6038_t:CDS:1 [Diversispora eburnea]
MREAKISFEFSSETCEHHVKIIIDGMSIPLINEDFNKVSSTKNDPPKSDLSLEKLMSIIKKSLDPIKFQKNRVHITKKKIVSPIRKYHRNKLHNKVNFLE